MPNPEDKIDYRYLNLDTYKFVDSQQELEKQISQLGGGHIRAINNFKHGQILLVASKNHFYKSTAIRVCRKIAYSEQRKF